jgi:hypothetical protein
MNSLNNIYAVTDIYTETNKEAADCDDFMAKIHAHINNPVLGTYDLQPTKNPFSSYDLFKCKKYHMFKESFMRQDIFVQTQQDLFENTPVNKQKVNAIEINQYPNAKGSNITYFCLFNRPFSLTRFMSTIFE